MITQQFVDRFSYSLKNSAPWGVCLVLQLHYTRMDLTPNIPYQNLWTLLFSGYILFHIIAVVTLSDC